MLYCIIMWPWRLPNGEYNAWLVSNIREQRHGQCALTPWDWLTHICVGKLTIIGSDNGLSPGRRQAIIWTNVGILLNWPLGTNFGEIVIEIEIFSVKKCIWNCRLPKWRPFCPGVDELTGIYFISYDAHRVRICNQCHTSIVYCCII